MAISCRGKCRLCVKIGGNAVCRAVSEVKRVPCERMRRRLCSEIMILKDVFLIKVVIRCVVFESKEKLLKGFRIRFLAGENLKFFEKPALDGERQVLRKKQKNGCFFGEMPPFLRIASGCENFFDRIISGNVRFPFEHFVGTCGQTHPQLIMHKCGFPVKNTRHLCFGLCFLSPDVCRKHHRISYERSGLCNKTGIFKYSGNRKHLRKNKMPASCQLSKNATQ